MKPRESWPVEALRRAHIDYPNACAAKRLFGAAFFGHKPPADRGHRETPESVWRGLCRRAVRQLASERTRVPA